MCLRSWMMVGVHALDFVRVCMCACVHVCAREWHRPSKNVAAHANFVSATKLC